MSVCVLEELEISVMSEKRAIGIDVGVKNMIVTSDGEYYENPDFLKKYERRIKGYQQELSRRKKGSKNYNKTLGKIEELYRKLKNVSRNILQEGLRELKIA